MVLDDVKGLFFYAMVAHNSFQAGRDGRTGEKGTQTMAKTTEIAASYMEAGLIRSDVEAMAMSADASADYLVDVLEGKALLHNSSNYVGAEDQVRIAEYREQARTLRAVSIQMRA